MPTSKSAQKRVVTSQKRTEINKKRREQLKTSIKKFEEAVESNNVEMAKEELINAKKVIDKSVSKGIIHKNNAARKKSRLDRLFNKLTA